MPIHCHNIRLATEAMQIELHIDSKEKRQFVTQRYAEWGYRVLSLVDGPAGEPRGIFVLVFGNDWGGIIDRMCHDPAFVVKC